MEEQTVSKNLIYYRKLKGYTQAELSEKTNVTIRTIQRIENDEVNPHLKTIKLLAVALEVDVDDLLILEDPKEETIQKKWLLLLHGTPVLGLALPLCNILIPLFIWIHKREDNKIYDRHGRAVINFHITMTIVFVLSFIALVTIEGYGFFLFIIVLPYTFIITLANIIAALRSQKCFYPLSFPFLRPTGSTVPKAWGIFFMVIALSLSSDIASSQPTNKWQASDPKLVWSKGYGSSHFDTDDGAVFKPVTPDTPFWIASVTKTFLGLLFLQLENEGVISLNDRINDMPGWTNFCNWLAQSDIIFGRDLQCDVPITIRNVLNHTVNGEPGTEFFYNPIMYSRLSRYIEYIYGNPIAAAERGQNMMARLIQEKILGPAGMNRTMSSQWQREKALVFFEMARGYEYKNGQYIPRMLHERHLAGGAGIVSTVNDLAKYDIALDTGILASDSVMKKLFTPAVAPDGTTLPYAFGWYVQKYKGEKLIWHSGWDEKAGFSALYLKVPEQDLTLILLANSEGLW